MFLLTKPSAKKIDSFLERAKKTGLSYKDIGATLDGFAAGGTTNRPNIDHNQIVVGNGEEDFDRAKRAVREWKMFDFPWIELCWPTTPIEEDQDVAIMIKHFRFYSLNAARIVYTIDKWDWFGFAYGTLEEHGASGEERFSVRLDRDSGDVVYDIYAFSKPNHFLAYLGYPLTRMLQKRFGEDSKDAMFRAVRDNRLN